MSILLVEKSPEVITAVMSIIESTGQKVVVAENFEGAKVILDARKPKLIIVGEAYVKGLSPNIRAALIEQYGEEHWNWWGGWGWIKMFLLEVERFDPARIIYYYIDEQLGKFSPESFSIVTHGRNISEMWKNFRQLIEEKKGLL